MPVDAKPESWSSAALLRTYRDVLGRPLSGTVAITGTARTEVDGTVTLPVPVVVTLIDGALYADLPPDTYELVASLRTPEGARVTDTCAVVID